MLRRQKARKGGTLEHLVGFTNRDPEIEIGYNQPYSIRILRGETIPQCAIFPPDTLFSNSLTVGYITDEHFCDGGSSGSNQMMTTSLYLPNPRFFRVPEEAAEADSGYVDPATVVTERLVS